jgi:hypothetical protein
VLDRACAPHGNNRYREGCYAYEGRNDSKRCHDVMRISGDNKKYRFGSAAPSYFTEKRQAPFWAGPRGFGELHIPGVVLSV